MDISSQILSGQAAVAESTDTEGAGFTRIPHSSDPKFLARVDEALAVFERGISGSFRGRAELAESLTTSDFPLLLGAGFERELIAQYSQVTPVWSQYIYRTTVKDFREKSLIDLLGGRSLLDPVAEAAPYPARSVDESEYKIKVGKFGGRIPITWEMVINDDLDALRDLPNRLAQGARDTENHLGASLLVDAAGANSAFFNAGNGNAPASAPLTMDNLGAAIQTINSRKDESGRPVVTNRGLVLVVPPELELQALAILNATEVRSTSGNKTLVGGNLLRGRVSLVVDPWLSVIAKDAKAGTRWFVLPAPSNPRPALAIGFLRGHETPDLRVKADTGQRVGGGLVPATEGSFDFDTIQYRVRHVLGSAHMDPIATYVSDGS